MSTNKLLFAVITTLGLATTGCTGEVEMMPSPDFTPDIPTTTEGNTAKNLFATNVMSLLEAQCVACHALGGSASPEFLVSGDMEATYVGVKGYNVMVGTFDKDAAPMITALVEGGSHSPKWLDPTGDVAKVGAWLDAELEALGAGGAIDPTTPGTESPAQISNRLKAEWSGCMNLTEWNNLQVAEEWGDKGSTTGICRACHDNGGEGAIYSENSEFVFDLVTKNEVYMLSYFKPQIVNPLDPAAEPKMIINYSRLDAVRNAEFPHVNHGRFDLNPNDDAVQALEAFYKATMDNIAADQCGPSRLEN